MQHVADLGKGVHCGRWTKILHCTRKGVPERNTFLFSKMAAPTEWKTVSAYAAYLANLLPKRPSAARLAVELRMLRSPFTQTRILLPLHCTACWSSLHATCPVVLDLLPPLNEWFVHLGIEVYETKPGKLATGAIPRVPGHYQHMSHAAILLHCLMTRHRCLEVLDGVHFVLNRYPKVFCDALRKSTLNIFHMTMCILTDSDTQDLVHSICGFEFITELFFDQCMFLGSVRDVELAFASIIAKSKSLRVLSITDCSLFCKSEAALIESLEKNESIEELVVGHLVLACQQGTAFRCFLCSNKTLRMLTIVGGCCATSSMVDCVFNALLMNSTLKCLRLKHFLLDLVTALTFVQLVTCNKTLVEVDFSSCSWDLDCLHELPRDQSGREDPIYSDAVALVGKVSQALPFISALKKTSSLRRLSLPQTFRESENRQLLGEAGNCHSLEELCFKTMHCEGLFYCTLQNSGASNKVKLETCLSQVDDFVWALQSWGDLLSLGTHRITNLDQPAFQKVVATLPLHDHITGLDLKLSDMLPVMAEDASLIAGYLSSTRVLKNIFMNFNISKELAHVVIEGLCRNDTIEKLSIENWLMDGDDVGKLCSWVATSRKVYHFSCICAESNTRWMLVTSLAQLLPSGYTLTFVHLIEHSHNDPYWLAIQQLRRRNLGLVECALSFVLGSTLKRAAAAFERMWWHPQVASRAQHELQLGPAEVSARIQECRRHLQADFWQITGVVCNELVCHERADLRKQIDQLGMDAWLCVRAFLTIDDVLDRPPKKQLRKRKRSA